MSPITQRNWMAAALAGGLALGGGGLPVFAQKTGEVLEPEPNLEEAEELAAVGLLPNEIVPMRLEAGERNPFERRPDLEAEKKVEKGVELSEEDRIRQVFARLEVLGIRRSETGVRVLLGDMMLQAGDIVPPVLPDQTQTLVVKSITEDEIELIWTTDHDKKRPRRVQIPVDMTPRVAFVLSGQEKEGPSPPVLTTRKVTAPEGTSDGRYRVERGVVQDADADPEEKEGESSIAGGSETP